ncbi:DNA repair protein RecN [Usitatibacter palustris]|uniref:DNA repair protein RecN n=1 Tax=Usitatibacter palustris TaxID=2732487 RepID=A0A6M4H5W9_9PROT|nr:DNA repair protein RecN [Usitatibacter palustris]QJR14702.1 DNA repair protein RecN [Usitatibacter palustris]
MLRALAIRDYVIVDRLDLELGAGFTALTGETGAGKSILVDALALALGGRADAGVVRTGCERSDISAEFEATGPALEWLRAAELEEGDGACVVRRTIDVSGRSRAFVNGRPATVAQLRELGERLLDIHGQHEHQLLLKRDAQRALLDVYAKGTALAREVSGLHAQWRKLANQRTARENAQASSARERELLAHEIRDLEALGFEPAQWAEEQAEHGRLAHAQELIETVTTCAEALDESEESATSRLGRASTLLAEAAAFDAGLEEARRDVEAANVHAAEAAQQLRRYLQKLEVDPGRLAEVDRRLAAVHDCARRFRVDPSGIPGALAERRARLAELGGEESLEQLKAQEAAAQAQFRTSAAKLSKLRRDGAKKLGGEVTKTMQRLGMEGGRLSVAIEALEEPTSGGLESIELQVSAHAGQPLAPLAKVASGGELSRLALAIQVLLSGQAAVPTLVFDEVDSGIGGGVAEIVGKLLQSLGMHHQVLCVTHLAQVASHARAQLRVSKHPGARGTVAAVEPLDPEERVTEIARMLGGLKITEATRRHAVEMLQNARAAGTSSRV